eukprot:1343164-Pyramimonas_sp.AAC.1
MDAIWQHVSSPLVVLHNRRWSSLWGQQTNEEAPDSAGAHGAEGVRRKEMKEEGEKRVAADLKRGPNTTEELGKQ